MSFQQLGQGSVVVLLHVTADKILLAFVATIADQMKL